MLAALCTRYSIPFAQEMVEQCVESCGPCQFLQRVPPPSQPLHPIPRVDAGDVWAFDFIGPLPKTLKGNQYLLTAMDLGMNWTIAQVLPRWSGQSVLEMLQYIIHTYGKPLRILTDNGDTTGICLARGISDFTISLRFSSTYAFPRFRCLGPLPCALADLRLRPLTYCTTFLSTPAPDPRS